nr:uncharacterized protein BN887_04412 [Melanopsichium pennsylvanicum 4]
MTEATATRRSARNVGKPVTATVAAAFTKPAPKRKAVAAATDQDASKDSKQNQKKRKATPIEKAINAATDSGTLKVGDKLPSFKLMIEDDNEIDTANLKNVILFS